MGNVVRNGDFGLGDASQGYSGDMDKFPYTGFAFSLYGVTTNTPTDSGGALIINGNNKNGSRVQIWVRGSSETPSFAFRFKRNSAEPDPWFTTWFIKDNNGNGLTTVDSNGFIKKASPIIDIYADGNSNINDEAKGASVTRISTGIYKISGVLGLNSDGLWWVELPKDINGQPLIWADYDVQPDGNILLSTYHRENADAPAFARNVIDGLTDGDQIDIPDGKYVSLRVNMPAIPSAE